MIILNGERNLDLCGDASTRLNSGHESYERRRRDCDLK